MRPSTVFAATLICAMLVAWMPLATAAGERPGQQPNILWITCEDMSPLLGCWGDKQAVTPNLDRLASEGVRYTNATSVGCVCTPARSALITGMYPVALGSQHLRGAVTLPDHIRCFTHYLRQAGYYCTNNFKEDYNFVAPPGSWDESSRTAHWRNRKPGQPFFAVFNIMVTHQGQIRLPAEAFDKLTARLSPSQRHDPAKVTLPPYYPDTPPFRREMARFYDLITLMDAQVGDLLEELERAGLREETIVFFYSDHGSGMPRHKRAVYDSGLLVPLIVKFPARFQSLAPAPPGAVVQQPVSFVDFGPTVLSLAGVPIPKHMHGKAFLGPQRSAPQQYAFGLRDRVDECFDMSRAVRTSRYKYIRNFMPHRPYMPVSAFCEPAEMVKELRRLAAAGKLDPVQQLYMRQIKPIEELYDLKEDPHELNNLADSPAHRQVLEQLRAALRRWMIEVRDTGLLPEAEIFRRAAGDPPYVMAQDRARFPVERILAAADLVGRPNAEARLIELLDDSDSAVRYWAAVGLMAPGANATPAVAKLKELLADSAPDVRIAAAEALCRLGAAQDAIPVLAASLRHDDQRVRLHAAAVLAAVGESARPALPEVSKVYLNPPTADADFSMFFEWALEHVFENLRVAPPRPPKGLP